MENLRSVTTEIDNTKPLDDETIQRALNQLQQLLKKTACIGKTTYGLKMGRAAARPDLLRILTYYR